MSLHWAVYDLIEQRDEVMRKMIGYVVYYDSTERGCKRGSRMRWVTNICWDKTAYDAAIGN